MVAQSAVEDWGWGQVKGREVDQALAPVVQAGTDQVAGRALAPAAQAGTDWALGQALAPAADQSVVALRAG